MSSGILIEVCCGSTDDAVEAERGGAGRVELNSSLFFGGLTPSLGSVIEAKKRLSIPVMVMIRPRAGGFCYTEAEMAVMEHDAKLAVEHGADGLVFGILNQDGTIDIDRCRKIVELTGEKQAVFHRAFDVTPNPLAALDQLIELGFKRILTSGQQKTVPEGADLIKKLIDHLDFRSSIHEAYYIKIVEGDFSPYTGYGDANFHLWAIEGYQNAIHYLEELWKQV